MASRRLAMGKGLDQGTAECWHRTLSHALHDAVSDTPVNRQIRAELDAEGWLPNTPGCVDSLHEALHTRDEALSEESSSSPPSTPL